MTGNAPSGTIPSEGGATMRDWMGAFRSFGGAAENFRQEWDYSSTPYLDLLLRICWGITFFLGFWVVVGIALAEDAWPYVQFALVLIAINLGLLAVRALLRRR